MISFIKSFGALRIALIIAAVLLLFIRPAPGTSAARSGFEIIPTLIAPAMVPIVFMVLLFDIMMCRIRMSEEDVRKKFQNISFTEIIIASILFIFWLPFFLAIGK